MTMGSFLLRLGDSKQGKWLVHLSQHSSVLEKRNSTGTVGKEKEDAIEPTSSSGKKYIRKYFP